MSPRTKLLALLAILAFLGCSAPPSNTVPDYANTRVKVNTGSAQSASLDARSSTIEIKNSKAEIQRVSGQLEVLKEQIQASRMKLAR